MHSAGAPLGERSLLAFFVDFLFQLQSSYSLATSFICFRLAHPAASSLLAPVSMCTAYSSSSRPAVTPFSLCNGCTASKLNHRTPQNPKRPPSAERLFWKDKNLPLSFRSKSVEKRAKSSSSVSNGHTNLGVHLHSFAIV